MKYEYMATAKFFFQYDEDNEDWPLTEEEADAKAKQAIADFKVMTTAMADRAIIHDPQTAGEETSFTALFRIEDDKSLTTLDGWYLDDENNIQDGLPE